MKLPAKLLKLIENGVDEIFDRAKVRFLGPNAAGKRIYIRVPDELTLPGIFEEAHVDEGGIPDLETLKALLTTAGSYLDALKAQAKARLIRLAQEQMASGDAGVTIGAALSELWADISDKLHRIVDTETSNVRGAGLVDGIVRANASLGVEDPTVCFIVVHDEHTCEECKRIHLMPDGLTPRVWKLSEVSHGYHKRGEDKPAMGGLHPHCRCMLTTILPGFGFGSDGRVRWIASDYDVHEEQG